MDIQFYFDKKHIVESVTECSDFIDEIINSNMYYYFPFSKDQLKLNDTEAQITTDTTDIRIQTRIDNFLNEFRKSSAEIADQLEKFCQSNGYKNIKSIKAILTPYGPYGYYLLPNTVFVNTSKGNSGFMIETFWHEALHLIFENNCLLFTRPITEEVIDDTFIELFGALFPNYKKQPV